MSYQSHIPDMAPSDYHCSESLKEALGDYQFYRNEDMDVVHTRLRQKPKILSHRQY
jgi:hypothetical protein